MSTKVELERGILWPGQIVVCVDVNVNIHAYT